MHIVSKFHDYYDTASAYGIDKSWVYVRKTETLRTGTRHWRWTRNEITTKDGKTYQLDFFIVGFCGTLYPGIRAWNVHKGNDERFIYDLDEAIEFVNRSKKVKYSWTLKSTLEDVRSLFGEKTIRRSRFNEVPDPDLNDVFREHRTPVFFYNVENGDLILNPPLREYRFYRVRDAFSAFQEIFQYLSGVLGGVENETVNISDEDMAAKKGYDDWSFRRHSEDSKKPRKRGK